MFGSILRFKRGVEEGSFLRGSNDLVVTEPMAGYKTKKNKDLGPQIMFAVTMELAPSYNRSFLRESSVFPRVDCTIYWVHPRRTLPNK